jgi:hypothetical protein
MFSLHVAHAAQLKSHRKCDTCLLFGLKLLYCLLKQTERNELQNKILQQTDLIVDLEARVASQTDEVQKCICEVSY